MSHETTTAAQRDAERDFIEEHNLDELPAFGPIAKRIVTEGSARMVGEAAERLRARKSTLGGIEGQSLSEYLDAQFREHFPGFLEGRMR